MQTTRRDWLKQTTMATVGLAFANTAMSQQTTTPLPGDKIILSSNENPYGPSPMARKAMQEAVMHSNRYPWFPTDITTQLREKIAKLHNLSKDHIMLGAGSSDILGSIAQHVALLKGNVVMADYTFRIWTNAAKKMGIGITSVPLTATKVHDIEKMAGAITEDTKMVYVCNPNNPTGTIVAYEPLKSFVEEISKTKMVVVDEAYIEYSDEISLAPLVTNNKNIIVVKTFSKLYGMAGARIGYAIAHPETITNITALQPWANAGASAVSLAGALATLDDTAFINSTKELNSKARAYTIEELAKLKVNTIPSHTNFLFFNIKNYGKDFLAMLAAKNILGGRIVDNVEMWSRITVGTMDEMKAFVKALQ